MNTKNAQKEEVDFKAIRHAIHAEPELRYEEHKTAALVTKYLEKFGVDEIHTKIGKTGVVGVINGKLSSSEQKAIGLRADMDALPIKEANTFAHASKIEGKMHACGHDGHTTMLLAAAKQLSETRNFAGKAYLIFQPAEEGGAGAKAMIDDGLFEKFPMQAIYGLHNWPGQETGKITVSAGAVMASSNEFFIEIIGKGSHAAMPDLGHDPVITACQIVQAFQNIITRNKSPIDTAVISVTVIQAGTATNVVPNSCTLKGTVRTFSTQVLDQIEKRMQEILAGITSAFNCQYKFELKRNYPALINNKEQAQICQQIIKQISGKEAEEQIPTMGAEDFAFMLEKKSGAYAFIGNGGTGTQAAPCTLHNPHYDFNDELIPIGANYWVSLIENQLKPRQN